MLNLWLVKDADTKTTEAEKQFTAFCLKQWKPGASNQMLHLEMPPDFGMCQKNPITVFHLYVRSDRH